MNIPEIQSQIAFNRGHINALHQAATDYCDNRRYYSSTGQPEKAEMWHKKYVIISKRIKKLVVLQCALKKDIAAAIYEDRLVAAWPELELTTY